MAAKRRGGNAGGERAMVAGPTKKGADKGVKNGGDDKIHAARNRQNNKYSSRKSRQETLDKIQAIIAERARKNAETVAEMGEEADRQLKRLVTERGQTPIQPAYVSVLTLALKRTGRLVDQVKTEHVGAVPIVLIPPKN